MGCEAMWLKHWAWRKRQKKFRAFRERYYKFDPCDTVEICVFHHEEIHHLYMRVIGRHLRKWSKLPCRNWSWEMAESLMKDLRKYCRQWLKRETPGMEPRKYADRPLGVSS